MSLSFKDLREANELRTVREFHSIESWSPTDWATATAGELGEACNLIKKLRRGEDIDIVTIGRELADTAIYLDLLSNRLGLDLGQMVLETFNLKSVEIGSDIFLTDRKKEHR